MRRLNRSWYRANLSAAMPEIDPYIALDDDGHPRLYINGSIIALGHQRQVEQLARELTEAVAAMDSATAGTDPA